MTTLDVLNEVALERILQDDQWGVQSHPNTNAVARSFIADQYDIKRSVEADSQNGRCTWAHILLEEVAEAVEETDPQRIREELVQVAAVCVAWVEDLDQGTDPFPILATACRTMQGLRNVRQAQGAFVFRPEPDPESIPDHFVDRLRAGTV